MVSSAMDAERLAEEVPEAQLIAASKAGDLVAFGDLVRRYQHMIDALAYRMSGSQADAADLAQETFIRAYRQLHTFRAEAKFSSWLYRIGINTCLNWRKSAARRDRLHREFAEQPDTEPAEPDPRSAQVQAALMQLPAKQRAAIILTVYEEMNHAEAARVLGCSETTISWRVFKARKQLKEWLCAE
jgi:RNA polymerase sigma-70 factor (ECF subfamily)